VTLTFAAGLILFAGWGVSQETRAVKAYTPNNLSRLSHDAVPADKAVAAVPADKVLRLHVKGNSNSEDDQEVKLEVRDALVSRFGETLMALAGQGASRDEAEREIAASLDDIERVSVDCLRDNGFSYGAKAALKMAYFPDRYYETASGSRVYLPAGEYRALVVELGSGEGDNWWCVMYPPLCYFDLVQRTVVRYGGSQEEALNATKEVALIVDELSTKEVPVQVRSLLLDSIRSGIRKLAGYWNKTKTGAIGAGNPR
jgi:stage II sporulation protein R